MSEYIEGSCQLNKFDPTIKFIQNLKGYSQMTSLDFESFKGQKPSKGLVQLRRLFRWRHKYRVEIDKQ